MVRHNTRIAFLDFNISYNELRIPRTTGATAMNILKTLRDGVHAGGGNGHSPAENPPDAIPPDATRHPDDREQPPVVGNGLPIKVKPESGIDVA
jgi:hypothetical protein